MCRYNFEFLSCMSKTNERWCQIFGKLSRIIPPLLISGGKTGITFCLLVRYCRKKFWWDKSIHFVCFPKKMTLSVSHDFSPFCPKFSLFLHKIAYFDGKQTNSIFFSKMKSLDHEDVFGHLKCYKITKSHDFMFFRS